MFANLPANQPVNTPYKYRREAQASYARGVAALAFSGLAAGAAYKYGTRAMPRAFTETFFANPRMLGWGVTEATTTGLESSLVYARKFGLGEWASGVPKFRWADLAMNFAKMAEEVSPSQIGRTFGLYEQFRRLRPGGRPPGAGSAPGAGPRSPPGRRGGPRSPGRGAW